MFSQSMSDELGFYLLEVVDFDGTLRIEMRVPQVVNNISVEIVCAMEMFSPYSTFNQSSLSKQLEWGYNQYLCAFGTKN